MQEEGVIKFNCNWIKADPPDPVLIEQLDEWRDRLYDAQLIGQNEDGIGYGNISLRYKGHFIITGSSTGRLSKLNAAHYTVVTDYDLDENTLTCAGPIIASSESVT